MSKPHILITGAGSSARLILSSLAVRATAAPVVVPRDKDAAVTCRDAGVELVMAADQKWEVDVPTKFQWMPGGVSLVTPSYGGRTIRMAVLCDESTARAVQASFDRWRKTMPKQRPFGCVEHREQEAAFLPTHFEWDTERNGVACCGTPTALGAQNVNGRIHRSWSPTFTTDADYESCRCSDCGLGWDGCDAARCEGVMEFPDGVRGSLQNPAQVTGVAFSVGSLTNKPAFRNIDPVRAKGSYVTAVGTHESVMKAWETRKANGGDTGKHLKEHLEQHAEFMHPKDASYIRDDIKFSEGGEEDDIIAKRIADAVAHRKAGGKGAVHGSDPGVRASGTSEGARKGWELRRDMKPHEEHEAKADEHFGKATSQSDYHWRAGEAHSGTAMALQSGGEGFIHFNAARSHKAAAAIAPTKEDKDLHERFYKLHAEAAAAQGRKSPMGGHHLMNAADYTLQDGSVKAHCKDNLYADVPDATEAEAAEYDRLVDGGSSHQVAVAELRKKRNPADATVQSSDAILARLAGEPVKATWSDAAREAALAARKANANYNHDAVGVEVEAFDRTEKAHNASNTKTELGHMEARTKHRDAAEAHRVAATEAEQRGHWETAINHSHAANMHEHQSVMHSNIAASMAQARWKARKPAKATDATLGTSDTILAKLAGKPVTATGTSEGAKKGWESRSKWHTHAGNLSDAASALEVKHHGRSDVDAHVDLRHAHGIAADAWETVAHEAAEHNDKEGQSAYMARAKAHRDQQKRHSEMEDAGRRARRDMPGPWNATDATLTSDQILSRLGGGKTGRTAA